MKQPVQTRESLAIEISSSFTRVARIQAIGEACLINSFSVSESLLRKDNKTILIDEEKLAALVRQLGKRAVISLVVDDPQAFNMVFRVPVATEDQVREIVRGNLRKSHQIDLSQFHWSVIAAADQTSFHEGITAPISKAKNVLISGTPKRLVQQLTESFARHGVNVTNVLFPVACQLRAFQLYGGSLLGEETVSLLSEQSDRFSVALFKGDSFIAYKEFFQPGNGDGARTPAEVLKPLQHFLSGVEEKTGLPVKCTFVSSTTSKADQLVPALKSLNRYARTWNAAKKLPIAGEGALRDSLEAVGAELNTAVGAALIGLEREHFVSHETDELSISSILVRPLALASCILVLAFAYLLLATHRVGREVKAVEHALKGKQANKGPVDDLNAVTLKINELNAFFKARRTWSAIVTELVRLDVKGVNVLQVHGAGGTSPIERNPFSTLTQSGARRKNSSRFVVEADNISGLKSLEEFITSIQANAAISKLLDQRTPVRLLGHYQSTEDPRVTRVSVEYRLNEKLF